MRTEAERKEGDSEAADGKTQQMPLVQGPASAAVRASGDASHTTRVKSQGEERVTAEVPQETVPMQAVAWPPAPVPVSVDDTAPTKPPPIRGKVKESHAGASSKGADASPRPGLFTAELRRALPPWALPLLTFQPFSVWLGSRLALGLVAVLAGIMLPSVTDLGRQPAGTANWYGSPGGPLLNGLADRLAGVWTRWDGQWYLKIATEGYSRDDGSAAFFPLYPWSVKVFGWLAGERYIWAGTLLSALFFLVALVLLHRLVRLDFHPKDAHRTIFYVAAFPMAFFFWAVYSESLFLLLAVATLLAARTQRWWWAAVSVSFAIWTRTTGLLLLLPLGWEMWRALRPPLPTTPDAMPPRRPSRLALASLSLPLFSLLGLLGWAAAMFGNPFASLSAQEVWNREFSWPWQTIAGAFRVATQMEFKLQLENQSWTYLGALVLAVVVGVLSLRWLRGSYSLYLWAGILFPLFSATRNDPLLSYPRFLIVLFPMFIVLALLGRNRYADQVITWLSIVLLTFYTIRFVNWYWVA
ncbi:MAG TPA: mannosyltransferase family protein [Chloroflexia bacterium]|nr:mannosyltransferase family protein [Chloroflexia bacterium]